jgi:hypothetical protein
MTWRSDLYASYFHWFFTAIALLFGALSLLAGRKAFFYPGQAPKQKRFSLWLAAFLFAVVWLVAATYVSYEAFQWHAFLTAKKGG